MFHLFLGVSGKQQPADPNTPSRPFHSQGSHLNTLKDVLEGPGDDAPLGGWVWQTLHGEGLPAARLSVGKDGAIVALSDALWGGQKPRSWLNTGFRTETQRSRFHLLGGPFKPELSAMTGQGFIAMS